MVTPQWLQTALHTHRIYTTYGYSVKILWEVGMIWIPIGNQPESYQIYRNLIKAVQYYLDHPKEADTALQKINRIEKELYMMHGWVLPDLFAVVIHTSAERGYAPPATWSSQMMGKPERMILQ